jgi:hypothetical protein
MAAQAQVQDKAGVAEHILLVPQVLINQKLTMSIICRLYKTASVFIIFRDTFMVGDKFTVISADAVSSTL